MTILDIRTILISSVITDSLCALVMAALWRQNRHRSVGLGFWLADFCLQLLAMVLIVLRNVLPDWVSILLGVPLILIGALLMYIGLERYLGHISSQRYNILLVAGLSVAQAYFVFAQPSLQARNSVLSVGLFVLCGQCAWLMLRRVEANTRPDTWRVGIVFAIYSLVSAVRLVVDLLVPPGNDLFKLGLYDTLAVLVYQILAISLAFALLLMAHRRVLTALKNDLQARQQLAQGLLIATQTAQDSERLKSDLLDKLNQAQQVAGIGSWDWNLDTDQVWWSDETYRLFGVTAQDYVPSFEANARFIHPADIPAYRGKFGHALRTGEALDMQLRLIAPTGAIKTCQAMARVVCDESGQAHRVIGTLLDITARAQAEVALADSESRYRALFEGAAIPIWEEDFSEVKAYFDQLRATGLHDWRAYFENQPAAVARCASLIKINEVNTATLQFFQVASKADIVGHLPAYFTEESWPVFTEEMIALAEGRTHFASEIPIRNLNGERQQLLLTLAVAADSQTTLDRVLVSFIDLTSRKQAEEEIQRLARFPAENPNPILRLDRTGRLLYANVASAPILATWGSQVGQVVPVDWCATIGAVFEVGQRLEVELECQGLWFSLVLVPILSEDYLNIYASDITNRKRAEAELRESHAKLELLFELLPVGVSVLDRERQVVKQNAALAKILGVSQAGLARGDYRQRRYLRADGTPMPVEEFASTRVVCGEPAVLDVETGVVKEDGAIVWTLVSAVACPFVDWGTIIVTADHTACRQAEQALRASTERFNALFYNAPLEGVIYRFVRDARGEIIDWEMSDINLLGAASLGQAAGDLIGRRASRLFGPDVMAPYFETCRQVVASGQARQFETYFEANGRSYLTSAFLIGHDYYANLSVDITARQQRERELEAIAQTALALRAAPGHGEMIPVIVHQVASLLKTAVTLLLTVDPTTGEAVVAFGQGLGADWLGLRLPPGGGIIGRVINTRRPYLTQAVAQEPLIYYPELTCQLGAIACAPLIAQDQIIGALWIGRLTTITEDELRLLTAISDIAANAVQRAQLVETLEQRVADRTRALTAANERLQELDRLKSKFVSDVSHELRTPVTSLGLYVDLLEHGKPEKRSFYLAQSQSQMTRLRLMIDEILDLARLERTSGETRLAPIELNAIIEHVVTQQSAAAETAGLQLTDQLADRALSVMAQPDQLTRAVTNLVVNAIKYTPSGWIQVKLTAAEQRACIEVTDTGLGIAPEDLPHVFDRFYRGKQVAQSSIPGTGLGLAIVKEIAETHGGTVEVTSQLGRGTTFQLWLPLIVG